MIPEAYLDAVLELLPAARDPVWCRLTGNSMEPLLCEGNMLLIQPGNRNARVGDVVVFKSSLRQCAHRIVRIRSTGKGKIFLTKGDNSYEFDRPIPSSQVLGKVLQVKGANGTLDLSSISWCIRNMLIACYSYSEGMRRIEGSRFWRFADQILTRFHNIAFSRLHRRDLYKCLATYKPNADSDGGIEEGQADEK